MRDRFWTASSLLLLSLAVPALALASEAGEGHGASLKEHGYYLINFLVFVGLLYLLAGDRIRAAVRDRSRAVGAEIREATAALETASAREAGARAALEGLPVKAQEIQAACAAEGERIVSAVAARAETECAKIRSAGEATVAAERAATQRGLVRELARRTLDRAEALLEARRDTLDQGRLFEGFIKGLDARGPGERP